MTDGPATTPPETPPETPEAVMRARYAAYERGDLDLVWRTWHPRTRPESIEPTPGLTWTGLTVLGAGVDDETHGWVEFVATYLHDGVAGRMHERSRFEWRAHRWLYVDGDVG